MMINATSKILHFAVERRSFGISLNLLGYKKYSVSDLCLDTEFCVSLRDLLMAFQFSLFAESKFSTRHVLI